MRFKLISWNKKLNTLRRPLNLNAVFDIDSNSGVAIERQKDISSVASKAELNAILIRNQNRFV